MKIVFEMHNCLQQSNDFDPHTTFLLELQILDVCKNSGETSFDIFSKDYVNQCIKDYIFSCATTWF